MDGDVEDQILSRLAELIRIGHSIQSGGYANYPHYAEFAGWRARSLHLLRGLFPEGNGYISEYDRVTERGGGPSAAKNGTAILASLHADVEHGYIRRYREVVAAEVFADFLDMADHLLGLGFVDPATSLAGAVLEDGLRRLARSAGIIVLDHDDLSSLSAKCADRNLYDRLEQKKIKVWTDLRNNADHGHFGKNSPEDVRHMLEGVTTFLADHEPK
jgi:hypothetical protein